MIYLREITSDDVDTINTWRNDKDTVDLLGANFRYINKETDISWFNNYQNNRNSQVRCGICIDDKLIGMVSMTSIDYINRKAEIHMLIGDKESRGRGYGKIALKYMINHAFYNLNLNKLYLTTVEYNKAAKELYKSLGFKKDGILRKEVYKNGKYIDCIIMSLLNEEFTDNK